MILALIVYPNKRWGKSFRARPAGPPPNKKWQDNIENGDGAPAAGGARRTFII